MNIRWTVVRQRAVPWVIGATLSLLLLGILAGCVTVSGQAPTADDTVEAMRQDIRSLDQRVATVEARLDTMTTTLVYMISTTPTPTVETAQWVSGGIALSYPGTLTSTLAMHDVTEVVSPQMSIDLDLWRQDDEVARAIANATMHMALIETAPTSGIYDLYVVNSLSIGQPAAWHYFSTLESAEIDSNTSFSYTNIVLGPGLPISRTASLTVPPATDLVDALDALAQSGVDLALARRAQILLLDESGATPKTILVSIDPEPPSGIDRFKAWCASSCRFRWCAWFCRRIR